MFRTLILAVLLASIPGYLFEQLYDGRGKSNYFQSFYLQNYLNLCKTKWYFSLPHDGPSQVCISYLGHQMSVSFVKVIN